MSKEKTITLGEEYDDALRDALLAVLRRNGAAELDKQTGVAGSQEVEYLSVTLGSNVLTVEAETFVGLTLTGPETVVERLAKEVHDELNRRAP